MPGTAPPLFPAPPATYDPRYMATLVRAFSAYVEQLRSAQPLPHVTSATSAATDGILMWDPVAENIVVSSNGAWVPYATSPMAIGDLSDVTVASPAQGQVLARGATEFQNLTVTSFTIGPFFANDIDFSTTVVATPMFFDTATTVARASTGFRMPRAGRVIGGFLMSQAARTGGTAELQVRVNSTNTAFDGGSVVINGTNTQTMGQVVAYSSGVSFAAGDLLAATVVTNVLWGPVTDFTAYLVVMLEPF